MTTNQPYGTPQTYAAQPYPAQAPWDGMAIASLITALCGLAIIPVVLGHLSLRRIRQTGARGQALAVVGLVLGYATCAAVVLSILFVLVMTVWAVNS